MSDNTGLNAGYESIRNDPQEGMGGGEGAHGSGVAGGYQGSQQNAQTQAQGQGQAAGTTAEKQDWLDKGIIGVGKKLGFNVSESNADKAGDFANKGFKQYEGRNIPGVQ